MVSFQEKQSRQILKEEKQ